MTSILRSVEVRQVDLVVVRCATHLFEESGRWSYLQLPVGDTRRPPGRTIFSKASAPTLASGEANHAHAAS